MKEGRIEVDGGRVSVTTEISETRHYPAGASLQFIVRVFLPSGERIDEYFAGIAQDERSAIIDALRNFADSSFHVIISALLDHLCEHATVEKWTINGIDRRVTLGAVTSRGGVPGNYLQWFREFEQMAKASSLPGGIHWIRIFHGQSNPSNATTEVLLDNEHWQPMESGIAALDWPAKDTFYTARLFLIIQDSKTATPAG